MEHAGFSNGLDTSVEEVEKQIVLPNAVISIVSMYENSHILPLPEMYGKNLIFKTGGADAC